ncbi:MAG: FAD/NAD(P)-binding protein [Hyphomonadaceae bacterium]
MARMRVGIAIVGGGLSGILCALHFRAADPALVISVIEKSDRFGPGLAYGAFATGHVLNVPVHRLDVGLSPTFEQWLATRVQTYDLGAALAEANGHLGEAFVGRSVFGEYLEDLLAPSLASGVLQWIRTEAVAFLDEPRRGLRLADGTDLEAEGVILATGNEPPGAGPSDLEKAAGYIANPWAPDALAGIGERDNVVALGTGLTAIDVVLALRRQGHCGLITLLSRRGQLPRPHEGGGQWPAFIDPHLPASPAKLVRVVRQEIRKAMMAGVPWPRVVDAVRPRITAIWSSWSLTERKAFLRHMRPWWDTVRHRMAPRIAASIASQLEAGTLDVVAGRIVKWQADAGGICIGIDVRGVGPTRHVARHVINCTGPGTDVAELSAPLLVDGLRRGLLTPDALRLGVETLSCAAVGADGQASRWLYGAGPMTRAEFWESTAVPEIQAQARMLAQRLCAPAY